MDCIMSCVVLLLVVLINYSVSDITVSGSAMLVSRVTHLVCKSNINLSHYTGRMVAYHQWYQVYDAKSDHFITSSPAIEALNTQLKIELEKFDNNTDIYNLVGVYNASNGNQGVFNFTVHCSGVKSTWINLLDDGFYEYHIDQIFNYDINEQSTFSCQAYSDFSDNIQVGWINTSANKIFVYNTIKSKLTLTAAHNGSMLCCIYYTVNIDHNGWKNIRRFVKDKTLLLLREKVPSTVQPSSTATDSHCDNSNIPLISDATCVLSTNEKGNNSTNTNEKGDKSNGTNEKGNNSNDTNEKGHNSNDKNEKGFNDTNEKGNNSSDTNEKGNNSSVTNEKGHNSSDTNETGKNSSSHSTNVNEKKLNTTDKTDSSEHDATNSNKLTIIVSSISATVLVLLVVIYVVNKRCRRDTNRRGRPQLPIPQIPSQRSPDEIDPNSPFYLNLLFRRECQLEIQAQEEPQYEEIMYQ